MAVPSNWDTYKTNIVFDFFKDNTSNQVIHEQRKKLDKKRARDYFATVYTGGPDTRSPSKK